MTKIEIIKGDITVLNVDAIVNAANSGLLGGGGVDGAIHRAGGAQILVECKAIRAKQGKLPAGGAVITRAGNLPAKYVIHTFCQNIMKLKRLSFVVLMRRIIKS